MIEYVVILISIIVVYFAYSQYFKPIAEIKRIKKLLEDRGYSVYAYPYKMLSVSLIDDEK